MTNSQPAFGELAEPNPTAPRRKNFLPFNPPTFFSLPSIVYFLYNIFTKDINVRRAAKNRRGSRDRIFLPRSECRRPRVSAEPSRKIAFTFSDFVRAGFFLLKWKENFFAGFCSERAGRRDWPLSVFARTARHSSPQPPPAEPSSRGRENFLTATLFLKFPKMSAKNFLKKSRLFIKPSKIVFGFALTE